MPEPPQLATEGPGAPPRSNGEIVFEAPWQSRVFGLAVALLEEGVFEWLEFQASLVREIQDWERANPSGAPYAYWERWQGALEALLAEKGILPASEVESRSSHYAARPHGHDH